jgi:ComF family protein
MTLRSVIIDPAAAIDMMLNMLLPRRCVSCEQTISSGNGLCGGCWQKMQFLEKPWCQKLGTPFSHDVGGGALSPRAIADPPVFDRLRAVSYYAGPARKLVLGLKFGRRRDLAEPMGVWMSRAGSELLQNTLVVPVPLHWTRIWQRRFNQAAELARSVAASSGADYAPAVLARTRRTRQQVGLPAKDRKRNVRKAFRVPEKMQQAVAGRCVVLVDDVYTTGSTVGACTKVLTAAGAASVDVLCFAIADPANHEDVGHSDW